MLDVTAYMIVCNEERHIRRSLDSLRNFRDVVIVDSGSTDATLEIAKTYKNVRIFHRKWTGYATQKQFALEQCHGEWVINLDADEEVSPELFNVLKKTIEENKFDAMFFSIPDYFLGHLCRTWKVVKKIRFFRRTAGHYNLENLVHEQIVLADGAKIGKTHAQLRHYGAANIRTIIQKQNSYSSLKADEKYAKGKRGSIFKLIFALPQAFIRNYIFKKDYRDGLAGFVGSVCAGFYAFVKEAKLFEHEIKNNKNG